MQEFRVYAPAKLNLYLDVLEKRPDGYHNIETLFEKIDLKDEIIITRKGPGIDVKVEPSICPSGKDNIVYKALKALFKEAKADIGLEIIIKKKIPVSGGLGGGSSDAASVLRAINEKFGLGVSLKRLFSIAAEVGKDIPFFLLDAPFAVGMGAGETIEPIDTQCSFSHIVIKPDVSLSTSEMYKILDDQGYRSKESGIKETISAVEKEDIILLKKNYYNVFERMLLGCSQYSQYIEKAKTLLLKAGSGVSFLSGSGPSVFCTFKDTKEAMEIKKRIPKGQGVDIFLATTYKGGIYGNNGGQGISKRRAQ